MNNSTRTLPIQKPLQARGRAIGWRDFLELTKPKVVALMILTSVIGMLLAAPGVPGWQVLLFGNLGIALLAGSAAVVNHIVDQKIDTLMARTRRRPVATGRISPFEAIAFAMALACAGMAVLMLMVNQLTAWLTLASLVGYAGVYTLFLKRATPQNITIGGLAGAMPPLLGWTAVTGQVEGHALLLVLIIFAWTPPHFWALGVRQGGDSDVAGDPWQPLHRAAYPAVYAAVAGGQPATFCHRHVGRYLSGGCPGTGATLCLVRRPAVEGR
ncbi:MAG: protoheme IX farnesyltransferase [Marinobacter sp. T13-3]|nr:MAG: protoheme IX farnesyltransferase [Marinobacter sp. T13-3]